MKRDRKWTKKVREVRQNGKWNGNNIRKEHDLIIHDEEWRYVLGRPE